MVTTNEGAPSSSDPSSDSGTALSKLRQTLSSSLMTAQDKGKSQLALSADWDAKPLVPGVSPRRCGLHLLPVYVVYDENSGNGTGVSSEDFRFSLSASFQQSYLLTTQTGSWAHSASYLELTWVDQRSSGMLRSVDWYSYRRFGKSYRSHPEWPSLFELLHPWRWSW